MARCFWVNEKNPVYVRYHDEEWGIPCHDDGTLYEMLILESFQAGLSWECILNKREAFREAYGGFVPYRVGAFDAADVERLMANRGIVRCRRKIEASIENSRVFCRIQEQCGSFAAYLWGFTGGKVIREDCRLRTVSPLSDRISRDLRSRGMRFVGSTTIYAYLQAVGILNAHSPECFCFSQKSSVPKEKG